MDANHRMESTWRFSWVVGRRHPGADVAPAVIGAIVFDFEARDPLPQPLRKRVECGIHGAKSSLAAGLRHFECIEDTRLWRIRKVRHVCVPDSFTGPEAPDGHTIFDDVRDDINL